MLFLFFKHIHPTGYLWIYLIALCNSAPIQISTKTISSAKLPSVPTPNISMILTLSCLFKQMPVWARKAYCTCRLTCWWTSCYRSQALQGLALQLRILRCCTWPGTRWAPGGDAAIRTERSLSRQWSSSCTKAEGRWISTQLAHAFLLFRLGLNRTLVFYHRKEKFSALRTASVVHGMPQPPLNTFHFLLPWKKLRSLSYMLSFH